MKRTLDGALSEILGPMPELQAVLLSAAPDGLIAWYWSRDEDPDIALGFAALDRTATACLEGLGASRRERNLLLTAENVFIAAWPLEESPPKTAEVQVESSSGLVLTAVFTGGLQRGMVLLHGSRVRLHIRRALEEARARNPALRAALLGLLCQAEQPAELLVSLAEATNIGLRRIERPETLNRHEQSTLSTEIARRGALSYLN